MVWCRCRRFWNQTCTDLGGRFTLVRVRVRVRIRIRVRVRVRVRVRRQVHLGGEALPRLGVG